MEINRINRINRDSINTLWVTDFYDGPISGICKYRDHTYYFDTRNEGGMEEANPEEQKIILNKYNCKTKGELLTLDDASDRNLKFNGFDLFIYYDEMQPDVYISYCIPRTFNLKTISWWQLKVECKLHKYFKHLKDNNLLYMDDVAGRTNRAAMFYFINRLYRKLTRKYKNNKVIGWY